MNIRQAQEYVASVRWQFASSMPQVPHEYTLYEWRPELGRNFDAFVRLIWTKGVIKPWPPPPARARYHHRYLELDGWEYWVMTERPSVRSSLINRARLDPDPARGAERQPARDDHDATSSPA